MANFIDAPQSSTFHKGLFGSVSNASLAYLQNSIASLKNIGGELGTQLYQRSMATYEAINGAGAVMAAKAILEQSNAAINPDIIRPLSTVLDFQTAKPVMINWLMTDTRIRQAWLDGRINGWSDTYVDLEPGKIGEQMTMYRQLHQGVLKDDPESSWVMNQYFEEYPDNATRLDIRDLANIFSSQERMLDIIEQGGEDPSDEYGGNL